jgi:hypothetical protein
MPALPQKSTHSPRGYNDSFHTEFFEHADRLKVGVNCRVQFVILSLTLPRLGVLNQNVLRKDAVLDGIARDSSLSRRRFWPG